LGRLNTLYGQQQTGSRYKFIKKDNSGSHLKLVTPIIFRKEVMTLPHDNLLNGHLDKKKTQERVARNFFWFEIREDISIPVSRSKICEKNRRPYRAVKAKMGNMTVGSSVDRLSTDIQCIRTFTGNT
jgi:hypothetical protein